jgi:uncharacterized Rmd1/YagE family protein
MQKVRFHEWTEVRVRAVFCGERLDLRAIPTTGSPPAAPIIVPVGQLGVAVLFRYGAVVTFNLDPLEEAATLRRLKDVIIGPHESPETEEADLRIDPQASEQVTGAGVIVLRKATTERILVVADVFAKSVVLAHYERKVSEVFDRIEPVAESLMRPQLDRGVSMRQILAQIGEVLLTQHRMVGRVEVTEKPDLLWDHPELERLHLRLQDEYELPDRDRALERKLELIALTANTSLGLLQERRSLRVEWYIVILIVIEIAIYLYDLFLRGGSHAPG